MATADGSPVRDHDNLAGSGADAIPRHTGLRLTLGILSIVIGSLIIARPINTLLFVAVPFGVQLVILGIVRIVLNVSAAGAPRGLKVVSIILGVLTVIAGLICIVRPNASLVIIAILLAAGWIADGIADLVRAFSRDRSGLEKTFLLLLASLASWRGLWSRSSLALRWCSWRRPLALLSLSSVSSPA